MGAKCNPGRDREDHLCELQCNSHLPRARRAADRAGRICSPVRALVFGHWSSVRAGDSSVTGHRALGAGAPRRGLQSPGKGAASRIGIAHRRPALCATEISAPPCLCIWALIRTSPQGASAPDSETSALGALMAPLPSLPSDIALAYHRCSLTLCCGATPSGPGRAQDAIIHCCQTRTRRVR
jgi:hypothetical protein